VKVANPSSQDRTPYGAILFAVPPTTAPYRASGFVLWREADVRRNVRSEKYPIGGIIRCLRRRGPRSNVTRAAFTGQPGHRELAQAAYACTSCRQRPTTLERRIAHWPEETTRANKAGEYLGIEMDDALNIAEQIEL